VILKQQQLILENNMPLITLNFPNTVQTSVQINDIAYYVPVSSVGGFDTKASDIVKIGKITTVNLTSIVVDAPAGTIPPSPFDANSKTNDFIMFSKDNKANMSSLLGYFARIKMKNNSTSEAELYSLGADFFESSK
tara:strand:- start:234 stop:641 length:408 start_codon:yes stop_codon:yes gene_type:complete